MLETKYHTEKVIDKKTAHTQKTYIPYRKIERRRPDLNRCVLVLQTIALPLGYCAKMTPTRIELVLPP